MRFFKIRGLNEGTWMIYMDDGKSARCVKLFAQHEAKEQTVIEYVDDLNARSEEIAKGGLPCGPTQKT